MKMRNKGKVHPSTSAPAGDTLSVLNLLPATILTLTITLSPQDQQVLAYMITHSINSSSTTNKNNKTPSGTHKPPVFECDCFDCYTTYWSRWDTSANRELIHQAIEAFEETLTCTEHVKKRGGKKREKSGHRKNAQLAGKGLTPPEIVCDVELVEVKGEECHEEELPEVEQQPEMAVESPETVVGVRVPANRGFVKKVIPDLTGLFNWRLWGVWSPSDSF